MSTRGLKEVLVFLVLFCGFVYFILRAWGCTPPPREPVLPPYCAVESAYRDELLKCVGDAGTPEESQECRRGVNERCGITETVARGAQ